MKERYEVWENFVKEDLPSGRQAICKYCGMSYKCGAKKNGTSVLWAHISRCRKYPFNTPKDSKQSMLSFKSAKVLSGGTSGLTYHKFDAGSIRKALSFMVIVDELPFKFVEGIDSRHFCGVMEPRFNVPSRITVAKDCFETYLTEKRKLKGVLKSSNDTAIGYMRRKINGWKTGVLKGRFLHMRCVAHIVNLVVSNGLKTVNESVQRVRPAVRFIKQSPARLQRFKKCVLDEKINTKKGLCLNVPTRWNSTYLMLNAAIKLEDAFKRYYEEDPHYVVDLNEKDDLVSSDDMDMCLMACRMKEKYEKYWGDPEKINLLIFIAVVLDPRYKLDYVEWMITGIYHPIVSSKLVDNVKEALNALYEEYRVSSINDVNREEVYSNAKVELEKYLEEDTAEDIDEFDILSWWKFNCSKFPTVGRISHDVLAVRVSTVASESAVSTGAGF
uniref:BED-type domain-containing protein n=1 Tax=Chenopodium quinoa TaxID=63459 RepID=A0A803MIS5_CHEQI